MPETSARRPFGPLGPLGRRFGAVLSATGLLLATGCGGGSLGGSDDSGGDGGPVKIGLVIPDSGVYEPLGIDMRRGFELYLEQNGGELGGYEIELVEADEGEGPDTGVPAVSKVVTQDQVSAVVGIVNSATALGVKETVTSSEVPLIVANAGADDLADGSDYVWRTSFTNGQVGAAVGTAIADEVDGEVYLMGADYAAGEESIGGFREAFEAAGGKIAGQSLTPFGTTTDYQPYLTRAKNSGAEAIYVFYAGGEAVTFVQNYNSFGIKDQMPLYGAGFLTEGGVLDAQGDAALGVRTALHYTDQIDTPENTDFVTAYGEAYDGEVPTTYSVQAYDAAAALDLALEDADGTSGSDIAAALGEVGEIPSPRGAWSFDEDHNPEQTYFLREVTQGEGRLVNSVVDEIQ